MPTVTALELARDAFGLLNVYLPGETPSANDGETARTLLNRLLSQWRTRRLFIPLVARERFDLVANQGGPTNPYTIGPGGDFDTERPPTQTSIAAANLILTATSPEVRVPLGILTTAADSALAVPAMSNSQPTALYYNPTYAGGLGSIHLWPVPNTAINDLELFLVKPLADFAALGTSYDVPDGADDALMYALAMRLAGPYGRQLDPSDRQQGLASIAAYKRSNLQLSDRRTDAYWATYGRRTMFNIVSGQ